MRCYQEIYGDDIDGNRGILVWNCEIDEDDYDVICEQLLNRFEIITLINPYTEEEVEFEVNVADYLV